MKSAAGLATVLRKVAAVREAGEGVTPKDVPSKGREAPWVGILVVNRLDMTSSAATEQTDSFRDPKTTRCEARFDSIGRRSSADGRTLEILQSVSRQAGIVDFAKPLGSRELSTNKG